MNGNNRLVQKLKFLNTFNIGGKALPFVLFFFAVLGGLAAQESGPVSRRLTWQPVDYASGYEVVVEIRTASNEWVEQFRRTSGTETFVDCPLFTGKYRFRVSALDLLGRPGPAAEWVYFEIRVWEPEVPEVPKIPEVPEETPKPRTGQPAEVFLQANDTSRFTLELIYSPLITLPFTSFNEIYATEPFQRVGFTMRFAAHPFENSALGFGAAASWNFLSTEIHTKSRYTHIAGGNLFGVWRIQPAGRSISVNIRIGGGLSYLSSRFDFNSGLDITNHAAWNPSVNAGVSLQSRFGASLFLDAGVEYFHIFSKDSLMLNYLRPMVGIGWLF
jgi:hypothetical protein